MLDETDVIDGVGRRLFGAFDLSLPVGPSKGRSNDQRVPIYPIS